MPLYFIVQDIFFRHLYEEHFAENLKLEIYAAILGQGSGRVPNLRDIDVCPICQGSLGKGGGIAAMAKHIGMQVWQLALTKAYYTLCIFVNKFLHNFLIA